MTNRPNLITALKKIENTYPALSLQNFNEIPGSKGTVFRITASHGKKKELTASDYVAMCQAEFGDKLALLPGSLDIVNDRQSISVLSGLMISNTISKPASRQDLKSLKVLSSNVFMDDDSAIWKLVGDGENRRLVQAINEDLSQILASRVAKSSNVVLANVNYTGIVPERGDYAIYFSLASMDYEYGYAVPIENGIMVAPRSSTGEEVISSSQVIDCVDRLSLDIEKQDKQVLSAMMGGHTNKITTQNLSGDMAKVYLDYMRNLYADTPYFDSLEKLISIRRGLADLNRPISTMVD